MKRFFLFVLLIPILLAFCFFKSEKPVFVNSRLYNELSKENFGPFDKDKRLNIIIGIDYLPYEFVEIFEEITGIKVIVDIFDSNEILEAKLLAGGTQYDIVFPTAWPSFSRQLSAKIYQPIDKNRIDFSKFDSKILEKLAKFDKDNTFAIPYQFGIMGIGLDEKVIDKVLPGIDKHDLGILFDPKNAQKLSKYRFSVFDSSEELFSIVLSYLGIDPESIKEEDIENAAEHLRKIRPYIYKFTSYGFEDLSSKNVVLTLGTSGDIMKVSRENNLSNIKFFRPKQKANLWVDVMAIPIGARHINNAHAFFKFLLHPKVIAEVTNQTFRANCVIAATKYIDKKIVKDRNIYPPSDFYKNCYIERPVPANIEALRTRLLTKIKSMM